MPSGDSEPELSAAALRRVVDAARAFAVAAPDYQHLLRTVAEQVAAVTGAYCAVELTVGVERYRVAEAPDAAARPEDPAELIEEPLVARRHELGILAVASRRADDTAVDVEQLAIVHEVARHAGLVISNARFIESVRGLRTDSFLDALIENLPTMLFVKDAAKLCFVRFNRAGEDLVGVPRSELIGKDDYAFFPPDEAAFFQTKDRETLAGKRMVDIPEEPIDTARGRRWLHTMKVPILDEAGEPKYLLGISEDITERKQSAETLARAREFAESIIATVRQPLIVLDGDLRIVSVNRAFAQLFEIAEGDVVGRLLYEIGGREWDIPELRELLGTVIPEHLEVTDHEVTLSLDKLGRRSLLVSGRKLYRPTNNTGHILLAIEDVTARRAAEAAQRGLTEALRERSAQLGEMNKELEGFTYSVSHDLRAPLRAIDGFSNILVEEHADHLDDEGKRIVGVIRRNTRRMGQLIDDLLVFSRLGRQAVRPQRVNMTAMANEVAEEITASEPDRAIQLRIGALPDAACDPSLVRQVWVNLIGNAVKYTRARTPAVVEVEGSIEGDSAVYQVRDNGVGFDMRYADKLFGVFQRLHSPSEFDGNGVGLALVQRIVRRHGGRVWAEGELNKGATFRFTLPVEERHAEP